MKEFSAKLRFSAENEEEFNKYVSSRVIFWLKYTDTRETAVRRAIEDAISNQYCKIFYLTEFKADHFDQLLAEWRSENTAPEMFRAMFEGAASC